MRKGTLVLILGTLLVVIAGLYFYSDLENTPSSDAPARTKLFADGRYEVRSFAGSSPLCGYDEVVDVRTNKIIYSSKMCEANIDEIQVEKDKVTIIKSSMAGREEIIVPR